jgi:Fic family protein
VGSSLPLLWQPIEDLPINWPELANEDLAALSRVWNEQAEKLRDSKAYQQFLEKLRRRIAIETGVIERLYTIDRGVTMLLVERGIDEALIPHGATDAPAAQVVALIRDHESALEGLFDFVARQRRLSASFTKQLHQWLTQHQDHTEAMDQFGNRIQVQLLKGDWKRHPNNPTRRNGSIHQYCPPEQVASQMDQLIDWHLEHQSKGVPPEVEAAWLHHRFTQIHPFQDGNGRVARMLASLVFIRAHWFPLVITRDDRGDYIQALEAADQGDLGALVHLFARAQRREFLRGLSLSEEALVERETLQAMLDSIAARLRQVTTPEEVSKQAEQYATALFAIAAERFKSLAGEIEAALFAVTTRPVIFSTSATADSDKAGYYRYQIIETAKQLDYYANLSGYTSWVNLTIKQDDLQTEFLLSFHRLGTTLEGVMVCSACAYRKVLTEEEGPTLSQDIQPLSLSPFHITYAEGLSNLERQFRGWLENVIVVGLEYWRKTL